jgi:hypothetical protein
MLYIFFQLIKKERKKEKRKKSGWPAIHRNGWGVAAATLGGKFGVSRPPLISNGGGRVHPKEPMGVAMTTPNALRGGYGHPQNETGVVWPSLASSMGVVSTHFICLFYYYFFLL